MTPVNAARQLAPLLALLVVLGQLPTATAQDEKSDNDVDIEEMLDFAKKSIATLPEMIPDEYLDDTGKVARADAFKAYYEYRTTGFTW